MGEMDHLREPYRSGPTSGGNRPLGAFAYADTMLHWEATVKSLGPKCYDRAGAFAHRVKADNSKSWFNLWRRIATALGKPIMNDLRWFTSPRDGLVHRLSEMHVELRTIYVENGANNLRVEVIVEGQCRRLSITDRAGSIIDNWDMSDVHGFFATLSEADLAHLSANQVLKICTGPVEGSYRSRGLVFVVSPDNTNY